MAIPCVGAVLHTLNIRLFADQLSYIVNHAEDQVIFVDDSLVPLLDRDSRIVAGVASLRRSWEESADRSGAHSPDGWVGQLPNALHYEELLEQAGPGPFDYPELDERQAAALCYTSGTTGQPQGGALLTPLVRACTRRPR